MDQYYQFSVNNPDIPSYVKNPNRKNTVPEILAHPHLNIFIRVTLTRYGDELFIPDKDNIYIDPESDEATHMIQVACDRTILGLSEFLNELSPKRLTELMHKSCVHKKDKPSNILRDAVIAYTGMTSFSNRLLEVIDRFI